MRGNPKVIEALNAVYQAMLSTEIQAHVQEHLYESEGYKKVSNWFDVIETKGHQKLTHYLIKRINALGGQAESIWDFQPAAGKPIEQLDQALAAILEALERVHAAYGAACEAAEAADDYVTQKMIWEHLEWLECQIGKFSDRAAQIAEMGLDEYLSEMFDK